MKKRHILLLAIFAVGLTLRLYRLSANDLWYDEALTFSYVSDFSFYRITYHDLHPPLYYLFLLPWIKAFGASEFILRLPSAIFSALAIPVIYKTGKAVFDRRVGILAALIFTLSPFQVWYAQEARSYAMSVFLAATVSMFLAQILFEDKVRFWKYFIIASILSVLTEYINFLIILSLTPLFLLKKDLFKRWILGLGVIFLGFSPWAYAFWKQISGLIRHNNFWIEEPSIFSITQTLKNFIVGYEGMLGVSALLIFGSFMIFGMLRLLRHRARLFFLMSPLLVTIAGIFLISLYMPVSIYLDRQLISVSIFLYVLLSASIFKIDLKTVRIFPLILLIIFSAVSLDDYYSRVLPNAKKPFKPLADFVNNSKNTGDIAIFGTKAMDAPLRYYLKGIDCYAFNPRSNCIHDFNVDNLDGLKIKRVWLFTGGWKRDGREDYCSEAAKSFISNYGTLSEREVFNGIFVMLYEIEG